MFTLVEIMFFVMTIRWHRRGETAAIFMFAPMILVAAIAAGCASNGVHINIGVFP